MNNLINYLENLVFTAIYNDKSIISINLIDMQRALDDVSTHSTLAKLEKEIERLEDEIHTSNLIINELENEIDNNNTEIDTLTDNIKILNNKLKNIELVSINIINEITQNEYITKTSHTF